VTAFAEDFRAEMEGAYNELLNRRMPRLSDARYGGVGGLAQWMRDEAYPLLEDALECGEPDSIEWACAQIGLGALMMRDASRALCKVFEDAYAGPEEGRDERIRDGLRVHALKMTGAQMISAERFRQIDEEKRTAEADDALPASDLAKAGVAYAFAAIYSDGRPGCPAPWPWDAKFWKPASAIRMLVKAGALIAAEIDRRHRAGQTADERLEKSPSTTRAGEAV
jgi:hypothetical protein